MSRACRRHGKDDAFKILDGISEGRRTSEDPGVDKRIILKWMLEKWAVRLWTGFCLA